LYVRGFERHWVTGRDGQYRTWEEPVRHYLRDVWANNALQDELFGAGQVIWSAANEDRASDGLQAAADEIHSWGGRTSFTISYPAVVKHAPLVAGDLPAGSLQRRHVKRVIRLSRDGDSLRAGWDGAVRTFDHLLNRAVRQRNRIIHGGTVEASVAQSIEPFLRQLSAWIVSASIIAAREGQALEDALEEQRDGTHRRYEHLRGASADAFFGPLP
jgi:hypothetical protein